MAVLFIQIIVRCRYYPVSKGSDFPSDLLRGDVNLAEALTFWLSCPSEPWSAEDANRLNGIYSTGSLFIFSRRSV